MKQNKKIVLGIIGILCLSILLFLIGWQLAKSQTETEQEIQFPYELEDGKLQIHSLFQASVSNPDSDDSYVENLAAIEIINCSSEHLQEATIEIILSSGDVLTFVLEEIPAGKTVWAFEVNNKCYETEQKIRKVECEATFTENTILLEEELNIEAEETLVSVKNISKETLKNLELKFHCLFDGVYYGGKTCTYQIDAIKADEEVSLDVWECYLGIADVVKIEK
jgi:hypothetical protein